MIENPYLHENREQLIDNLMSDTGVVWRRGREESLNRDDFAHLMRRIKQRLEALREVETAGEPSFVLTDAGAAVAAARKLGREPIIQRLMNGLGVFSGRELLERQSPPNRMRTVGHLGVIDGDRA